MMAEKYPNLKEEVGGSIPGGEIFSLHDRKLARWSIALCALVMACWPYVKKTKQNKTRITRIIIIIEFSLYDILLSF